MIHKCCSQNLSTAILLVLELDGMKHRIKVLHACIRIFRCFRLGTLVFIFCWYLNPWMGMILLKTHALTEMDPTCFTTLPGLNLLSSCSKYCTYFCPFSRHLYRLMCRITPVQPEVLPNLSAS